MPEVLEYEDEEGRSPFGNWFRMLDARAAARVTKVLGKLGRGLRPDVEPVGHGVFESKVHFGPGYRLYFGLDGDEVIILVGGGNKASQSADISDAKHSWADYKARKKRTKGYASNS